MQQGKDLWADAHAHDPQSTQISCTAAAIAKLHVMHIAALASIRMCVLCHSQRCRNSKDISITPSPQARVMGTISGGLPGGLQCDVLGALTAFLKLCPASSPFLVPQLEFLVALLPQGLLTARLSGSGGSFLKPSREAITAPGAGLPYAAVPSLARHAKRPPLAGALEQPCHSALWWLLALDGPGAVAAVPQFTKELIRVLIFAADCVLEPDETLLQFGVCLWREGQGVFATVSSGSCGRQPRPLLPADIHHC